MTVSIITNSIDEISLEEYRFERKFILPLTYKKKIELLLKLHPAKFSEAFPPRSVNNIYFDMPSLKYYYYNIDGIADRCKVRIRWYGDLFTHVKDPKLELKIKNGNLCNKIHFSLQEFNHANSYNYYKLAEDIEKIKPNNGLDFTGIIPTMLNSYHRQYYISKDKRYRFTIDTEVKYFRIRKNNNSLLTSVKSPDNFIMELKYNVENDDDVSFITNYFPFRLSKSSKYVNGINVVY